jgi:N-methylhydantoinase A
MFTLDIGRDYVRSYIRPLSTSKAEEINQLYEEMTQEALAELKVFNAARHDLWVTKSADLRYIGQYHEVEIELPTGDIVPKDTEQLAKVFHQKHEALYTFSLPWVPIEIRVLRLIAKVQGQKIDLIRIPKGTKNPSNALKRTRECFFNGKYTKTPVYDSEKLKAGNIISGPAIIEVPTTTAVIPRNFQCKVDDFNNYILTRRS